MAKRTKKVVGTHRRRCTPKDVHTGGVGGAPELRKIAIRLGAADSGPTDLAATGSTGGGATSLYIGMTKGEGERGRET